MRCGGWNEGSNQQLHAPCFGCGVIKCQRMRTSGKQIAVGNQHVGEVCFGCAIRGEGQIAYLCRSVIPIQIYPNKTNLSQRICC